MPRLFTFIIGWSVIVLLFRRFADLLQLGIEVCLSGKTSVLHRQPCKVKLELTPSTNETKLKNGTHSCIMSSPRQMDSRHSGLPERERAWSQTSGERNF